jgi:hypothetical protein
MIDQNRRFPESLRAAGAVLYLMAILIDFGTIPERVFAAETQQPFAALKAEVDIDIEDGELELLVTFTLGSGSNGIDPTKEAIRLQLKGGSGAYSVTIPAGSFKKDRSGFTYQGAIDRVKLRASIRPSRDGAFEFELENERANLKGFANPVTVSLAIGNHGGSVAVSAKIE